MSNKLYKVFEDVEGRAGLLSKYWNNFYVDISQHLPSSYQPEMKELSTQLENALAQLIHELRNPTLTIATTGTTSSGKSTLINLLCGAEIVPMAVSEMSAGAVTIEYNEETSLTIHETNGAVWECGTWKGISEEEIYQHLHEAMIIYIDSRDQGIEIACPQSTVRYPFIFLEKANIELPRGTQVKILDLPGLSYVGDESNAATIRQCREALCIMTYNSTETDPKKVKSLLAEVVEQVKGLRGSPSRMLFVLNRIDVFRSDRNWPESEQRFVRKTTNEIKGELTEHLKEYKEEIEELVVANLSTLPALLALEIQDDDDDVSIKACREAKDEFGKLIRDLTDELPGSPAKWNKHDRKLVADTLWQKSYASEFEKHLSKHIVEHFPQLVIPQSIERFNVNAGNVISEWVVQTTAAILNSSEENYHQECQNIEKIKVDLERLLEISNEKLKQPFDEIAKREDSEPNFLLNLEGTLKELQDIEPYSKLGKDKLYPIYGWSKTLSICRNAVIEKIAESLKNGQIDLDDINIAKADKRHLGLLEGNLKRLVGLGYTGYVAKNGVTRRATTYEDRENLKKLNDELGQFSINLNLVMEDILKEVAEQEIDRMNQAVTELFNCYLAHLEKEANDIAPKLAIKFPKVVSNQTQNALSFDDLNFESGFKITKKTWEEKSRSFGHWLWIVPKIEARSSDNADIPKVDVLIGGWDAQAKKAEPSIAKQIIGWLLQQITELKNDVDDIQRDFVKRYKERLDKANREVTVDYEKQKSIWLPMQKRAQELEEKFSELENLLKGEEVGEQ